MKKLKESLEWNKRDKQRSKKSWGMKRSSSGSGILKGGTVIEHFGY